MKRLSNSWRIQLTAALAAGCLLLVAICCLYRAARANPATAADVNDLIGKRGSLTFRSWDGRWIGTDCDTDITFLPDQVVYIIESGIVVQQFKGTYRIDAGGEVTIRLDDPRKKWPIMLLDRDTLLLRLRPQRRSLSFLKSDWHEATIWDGKNSYWPFRPVTVEEDAMIRARRLGQ
jgi:hypothetical protein